MEHILLSGLTSGDRAPTRSAGNAVYEDLRNRILRLELKPDAVLSRNELAKTYSVSLTPIREALQALEQDGLVRIRPQSSTVVTRIDPKQLRENQFLRESVEVEVVRRLAENPVPGVLERARAYLDMQAALNGDASQSDLFTDLDRSFHRTLFEGAGVVEIHELVSRGQGHLARCQRLELPWSGKMDIILKAHRDILDGMEKQDPQAAMDAMRRHLTGTYNRIAVLRESHPEFFPADASA